MEPVNLDILIASVPVGDYQKFMRVTPTFCRCSDYGTPLGFYMAELFVHDGLFRELVWPKTVEMEERGVLLLGNRMTWTGWHTSIFPDLTRADNGIVLSFKVGDEDRGLGGNSNLGALYYYFGKPVPAVPTEER